MKAPKVQMPLLELFPAEMRAEKGKINWKKEPQQAQPVRVVTSSLVWGSGIPQKFVLSLSNPCCALSRAGRW